ncbi:hypothetical protein K474DRAFT_863161 [Panus rudis PR-1116 ss-1]|nr:hypothetical protein K474DRAFT_863161 [Panus rudis PR-1116 ss-1]
MDPNLDSLEHMHASASSSQSKPRRLQVACAECRRSKLKCDRYVPCSACVRRGCSAICPDGALEPRRGDQLVYPNQIHAALLM